ncbi:hypothetical protein XENOCAPTIV_009510, partial [Xenoophorus captivus]
RLKRFFSSPRTRTQLGTHRLHAAALAEQDPPNSGVSADAHSVKSEACRRAASRSNTQLTRNEHGSEADLRAVSPPVCRAASA